MDKLSMYNFPEGFVEELSDLVAKYNLAFMDYLGIISLFSNTLIKELISRYEIPPEFEVPKKQ